MSGHAGELCSRLSAHSNTDGGEDFGIGLRPLGFAGSSALNSARENSVCCGAKVSYEYSTCRPAMVGNGGLEPPTSRM